MADDSDAPVKLVLTGGGSRIDELYAVCEQLVGPARVPRPDLGDPATLVARGLAAYGRWEVRVDRFHAAVEEFLASEELRSRILAQAGAGFHALQRTFHRTAWDALWGPLKDDIDREVMTVEDVDLKGAWARWNAWFASSEPAQREFVEQCLLPVTEFVNARTKKICTSLGVDGSALELSPRFTLRAYVPDSAFWRAMVPASDLLTTAALRGAMHLPRAAVEAWVRTSMALSGPMLTLGQWMTGGRPDEFDRDFVDAVLTAIREDLERRTRDIELLLLPLSSR